MSKPRAISLSLAVAALGFAIPVHAQTRSTASTAELEAAVSARPTDSRQAVRDFLANPQVERVAGRMGVSTQQLSAGVATLDQAAVDRIAGQEAVTDLAGGDQKIVISATVVIIALLIIILLTR